MKRRLKVAVWHNFGSGGAKRALYDQVVGLQAQGHHVEVWCPPSADRSFLSLGAMAPEHVLPLGPFELPRVDRAFYSRLGAMAKQLERFHAVNVHARLAADEINATGADVVLTHICQWVAAPPLARYLTRPSVLFLHEPYRFLYEASPTLPWPAEADPSGGTLAKLRRFLGSSARLHPHRVQAREERESVLAFNRVLVNSRFSRESALRAYGVDAHVCYLGVDAARFANAKGPRTPIVLSVGQFSPLKNPAFVIDAVARTRTRPTLRWIANTINDQAFARQMRELADSRGVAFDLRVNVSEEELIGHYQQAAVFAYAPRLEPFGFAPLEANACGLPVVAVAEGGVRETIVDGENGLLVDDPQAMAAAIDALVESPDRARALGQRAASLVRDRWTLDAAAARLERHLFEVAAAT